MKRSLYLLFFAISSMQLHAANDVGPVIKQLSRSVVAGESLTEKMKLVDVSDAKRTEYYVEKQQDNSLRVLRIEYLKNVFGQLESKDSYLVYTLQLDGGIIETEYTSIGTPVKQSQTVKENGLITRVEESLWNNGAWELDNYDKYNYDTSIDASIILGSPVPGKKLLSIEHCDALDNLQSKEVFYYSPMPEIAEAKKDLSTKITEAKNAMLGITTSTVASQLQTVIDQAQAIVDNEALGKDAIDAFVQTLNNAITKAKAEEKAAIDAQEAAAQELAAAKTSLQNKISSVKDYKGLITTPKIAAELQSAIDAAQKLFDSETATKAEIENMISSLSDSLTLALEKEKEALSIDEITIQKSDGTSIYTIDGKQTMSMDANQLYIKNGQKVIIK